jgi:hypothetical protein
VREGDVAGVHGCKGKFAFVGRLVTCRRVGCILSGSVRCDHSRKLNECALRALIIRSQVLHVGVGRMI